MRRGWTCERRAAGSLLRQLLLGPWLAATAARLRLWREARVGAVRRAGCTGTSLARSGPGLMAAGGGWVLGLDAGHGLGSVH